MIHLASLLKGKPLAPVTQGDGIDEAVVCGLYPANDEAP
jgi:hypothetical protein